jgi:hypothetical protein
MEYGLPQYLEYEMMRLGAEPEYISEFSKALGKLSSTDAKKIMSCFDGIREYAETEPRIRGYQPSNGSALGDLTEDPFSMEVLDDIRNRGKRRFSLDIDDERKENAIVGDMILHVETLHPNLRKSVAEMTMDPFTNAYEELCFRLDVFTEDEASCTKSYKGTYLYRHSVSRPGPGNKYDIAYLNRKGRMRMPVVVLPIGPGLEYTHEGNGYVRIDTGDEMNDAARKKMISDGLRVRIGNMETLETRRTLNGYRPKGETTSDPMP